MTDPSTTSSVWPTVSVHLTDTITGDPHPSVIDTPAGPVGLVHVALSDTVSVVGTREQWARLAEIAQAAAELVTA